MRAVLALVIHQLGLQLRESPGAQGVAMLLFHKLLHASGSFLKPRLDILQVQTSLTRHTRTRMLDAYTRPARLLLAMRLQGERVIQQLGEVGFQLGRGGHQGGSCQLLCEPARDPHKIHAYLKYCCVMLMLSSALLVGRRLCVVHLPDMGSPKNTAALNLPHLLLVPLHRRPENGYSRQLSRRDRSIQKLKDIRVAMLQQKPAALSQMRTIWGIACFTSA